MHVTPLNNEAISNHCLIAIFIMGTDGRILKVNKAGCDLFGYAEVDFQAFGIKLNLFENQHFQDLIHQHSEDGSECLKLTGIKKNGDRFPLQFSSFLFEQANGDKLISISITDISARKNAENDMSVLINNTADLIWSISRDHKIIAANYAFKITLKSATGKELREGDSVFAEVYGEEVNMRWEAYYNRALQGEKYTIKEHVNVPLLHKIQYALVSFNPIYNEKAEITGVACYSKDITEDTLSTAEIQQAKSRLDKIMKSSADLICALDKDGFFLQVSAAAEIILGYKPEEMIGKLFSDFVYPEDFEITQNAAATVITGINLNNFENRYIGKDGRVVPLTWNARWDANDEIRYAVGRDATEKKKVEEQLKESEERYRKLFFTSPITKFIVNAESLKIVDVNQAATDRYGYSREEFLTLTIKDITPEENLPALMEARRKRLLEKSDTVTGIFHHQRKDKTILVVEVSGNTITWFHQECMLVECVDVTEREKALKDLSDRELKLQHAQQIAKLGYWQRNLIDDSLYWSDEVYNIWGLSTSILPDFHTFLSTIHPDDKEGFLTAQDVSFNTGEDFNFEHRIILLNGEIKWVLEHGDIEKDGAGKIISFNGTVQDITTQKLLALSLEKSTQRYHYVTKATSDAIWDWDIPSGDLYWGDGYYTLFGRIENTGGSEVDGARMRIHPEDADTIYKSATLAMKSGDTSWRGEYRYLKADGNYAYVVNKAVILRDENGRAFRVIGAKHDITQRKKEEQHLKLLESVIIHTNDAVFITEVTSGINSDLKIIYVNEAYTNMCGYTAADLLGKKMGEEVSTLRGPKSDIGEHDKMLQAIANAEPCEITQIHHKKNGEEFWNNFSMSPVTDDAGEVKYWISIERDVTQRKNEELLKMLMADVSKLFTETESLHITLVKMLERLNIFGNSFASQVWLLSANDSSLYMAASVPPNAYSLNGTSSEPNKPSEYKKGLGLPGIVWETGTVQYSDNIDSCSNFEPDDLVRKTDTHTFCGVPLRCNNKTIGVLVISPEIHGQISPNFTDSMRQIGQHAGTEIKRKQPEYELNRIFSFAPDVICIVGADGYFKKINPAACEMSGYTEEELLAVPYLNFIHPEDKEKTLAELTTLSEGVPTYYFENRYITKSGKPQWLAWTCTPLTDEGVIYGVAKNITDRKELEDLLNKANCLSKIGGWDLDVNTGKLYWSLITKEIHETTPAYIPHYEEAVSFYKGTYRESIKHRIEEAVELGKAWDDEYEIITALGNEKWIRVIGEAEFNEGKVVRIYGSVQDINKTKTAELAVTALLREKNTILESIGDGFFAVDRNWVATYWNKKAEELLNIKKEDILGKNLHETFSTAHSQVFYVNYLKAFTENIPVSFEEFSVRANKWFAIDAFPSESGLSVYFKDVTDRRAAQESIKNSEEKRRLIMNAALDAIICLDTSGNVTFWNPKAEVTFGWNEAEMMGKKLSEYIIPEKYPEFHDMGITNYLKTGKRHSLNVLLEFSALNKAGDEFPIELTISPIRQGNEEFFCVFIRDISQRKQAENTIRTSNEHYNFVAKATNDSIWNLDIRTGTVMRSGEGFHKLFGYANNTHNTDNVFKTKLIHPEDLQRVLDKQSFIFNDPHQFYWEDEYRFLKTDGNYAFVYDKGYILRDEKANAITMIGATQDITKLRAHEDKLYELNLQLESRAVELAESNAELEQFAFVASHDLQEPLRMVTGFLSQLDKKYSNELDERGKKYIYFAVDGAQRMRQIILDLLEFSRVGRNHEEREDIDVNEILNEILILFSKQIEESQATLTFEKMPIIRSYRSPVRQIFHNLISNALKYKKEEGIPWVDVGVKETATHWHFRVTDNGIGISKDYFEKIFIIFQRLHTNAEFPGNGMGLTITKKIIENLGGKIAVDSEQGKGSMFSFTIAK